MKSVILNGDCLSELKDLPDDAVDSLVTDPPAGISFMGKDWDGDKGGRDQWIAWMTEVMKECMRVLKPGAHGLVWAIPRTSHWTATALENAGFEVRDVVTHLFGTGFPKSLDISKAIDKAAGAEREVIGAFKTSGGIRGGKFFGVSGEGGALMEIIDTAPTTDAAKQWQGWGTALKPANEHWILVRKPCSEKTVASNVLKWGTGGINIDMGRVRETEGEPLARQERCRIIRKPNPAGRFPANLILDEIGAAVLDKQSDDNVSRFFFVAKASKNDKGTENTHPTAKPTTLMSYLIKLITPPDGVVLDPFAGSGSTGVAAVRDGFRFIGIEQNAEYAAIAESRILKES